MGSKGWAIQESKDIDRSNFDFHNSGDTIEMEFNPFNLVNSIPFIYI